MTKSQLRRQLLTLAKVHGQSDFDGTVKCTKCGDER
jgi:hypothetical protein